jgi:5-methylcytosine-specific restriction endonuclease McrA
MGRAYNYKFQKIKPVILFIWGYRCYVCKKFGLNLDVHHINKKSWDNGAHNLIPLCKQCHKHVHNALELEYIVFPDDVARQLYYLDQYWENLS